MDLATLLLEGWLNPNYPQMMILLLSGPPTHSKWQPQDLTECPRSLEVHPRSSVGALTAALRMTLVSPLPVPVLLPLLLFLIFSFLFMHVVCIYVCVLPACST